jgi:hypothetical protein
MLILYHKSQNLEGPKTYLESDAAADPEYELYVVARAYIQSTYSSSDDATEVTLLWSGFNSIAASIL